jgi:adenylate cyclase
MTRHQGGAEIELTMLFADVRGSTLLAEQMNASDFSRLMKRFYVVATEVLVKTDALIDKLVGDEVIGLFIPGYAGPEHARQAVQAAQELLHVTGHRDPGGPWLPVGVGVHTGVAYLGAMEGSRGTGADITALGDNVNITARLSSNAAPGEILISDATYAAAKLDLGNLEQRQLELKGKSELVNVRVLGVGSSPNRP